MTSGSPSPASRCGESEGLAAFSHRWSDSDGWTITKHPKCPHGNISGAWDTAPNLGFFRSGSEYHSQKGVFPETTTCSKRDLDSYYLGPDIQLSIVSCCLKVSLVFPPTSSSFFFVGLSQDHTSSSITGLKCPKWVNCMLWTVGHVGLTSLRSLDCSILLQNTSPRCFPIWWCQRCGTARVEAAQMLQSLHLIVFIMLSETQEAQGSKIGKDGSPVAEERSIWGCRVGEILRGL